MQAMMMAQHLSSLITITKLQIICQCTCLPAGPFAKAAPVQISGVGSDKSNIEMKLFLYQSINISLFFLIYPCH